MEVRFLENSAHMNVTMQQISYLVGSKTVVKRTKLAEKMGILALTKCLLKIRLSKLIK